MDNDVLVLRLKAAGHSVGQAVMRADGVFLFHVDGVFMFRPDAVDIANGTATLRDVVQRNAGLVFPQATVR